MAVLALRLIREITEASKLKLPRAGPDEQPIEKLTSRREGHVVKRTSCGRLTYGATSTRRRSKRPSALTRRF